MRAAAGSSRFLALVLVLAAPPDCLAAPPAVAAPATVEPARVPAAERRTALLRVEEPGRYAIAVTSGSGTGLQLVDRMAGPGPIAGAAGERDGRIDELLDRGTYRLVTHGPDRAAGEATLGVHAFHELHAPQPPLLVEGKPVSSSLGDLEQRSWWLRVGEARRVVLEAAGRNLADLRLFRDGGWLVDAALERESIEPEPGRPLRSCRLAARLEPGLYLLTAFGGVEEAWPAGGDAHPLYLRSGIPLLGDAGRTRYRVGPFGADAYLLPANVTFVQLELSEPGAARLTALPYAHDGDPFADSLLRREVEITKQHREPVATLDLPHGASQLVVIRAPAGQAYVLQHFERRNSYSFSHTGRYWISSVHSGHPQDSADATAIVTGGARGAGKGVEPLLSQAVEIGAARGWARRCNLLERLTVFFRVRDAGRYEVLSRGTAARFRFEPFLTSRPQGYREPPLQGSGSIWELAAGWHVLTVIPEEPGIVEAAVRPAGKLNAIWDLLDPGDTMRADPVRPAVTFPDARLDWQQSYTVWLNERPGVRSGIVLRSLPVDLAQPLPMALVPGELLPIEARVAEPGTIRAETEAGEALELRAGTGPWAKAIEAQGGGVQLSVRNAGRQSVLAAVRFEPRRLRADAPLPALAASELPPLPAFPRLDDAEPRFLDLGRGGSAVFAVDAAEPAFHTVESTGLLATRGTLRSRFIPSLAEDAGGGTGRNFLVGAYLREGAYQLDVRALGSSAGHLGLRLRRSPQRDGGALRAGTPSRVTVAAAEGVVHPFAIDETGIYRISAFATGRALPCRLEDAEGFPLETPGTTTPIERRLEPGRYRVVLAPEAVGSRRVTLLERVVEPQRLFGHGPHPLALDLPVDHVWEEPAEGLERTPDRWEFQLPAPATLAVTLTGEMQGEIRRRGDAADVEPVARVLPGRTWSGKLEAGRYTLAAVCSRRNNLAPYRVEARPVELVADLSRAVTAPATIDVAVGAAGLYEFASFGASDVRARLLDEGGATLAEQEDRPDDWNVQLAVRLAPGRHRLELAPTGADHAPTTVAMRAIPERVEPPLPLPGTREVAPADAVVTVPLAVPAEERLLVLRARAGETIGAAVDRTAGGGGWETVWSGLGRAPAVEIPIDVAAGSQPAGYRARLWSLDRRGGPIALSAAAVAPARVLERDLRGGVAVRADAALEPPLALMQIVLERPGLLRLDAATPWRASGALHRPLAPAGDAPVAAQGTTLWLAAAAVAGSRERVARGERLSLTPDQPLTVDLPADGSPVACDIEPRAAGPVLVVAQSAAGRPGVAIVARERPGSGAATPSAHAAAVLGERAASALLPAARAGVALVWRADPGLPAAQATLRIFSFPAAAEGALPAGAGGGRLDSSAALRLTLPRGDKRLRLALGPGIAAALVHDGVIESAHDAGAEALDESVETAAESLVLVNAGLAAAPWSTELVPIAGRERTPPLTADRPLIARFPTAGTLRLRVAADDGRGSPRLLVSLNGSALLLGDDGRIVSGGGIPVGSGGRLLLSHGTGIAAAWVEPRDGGTPGLWGGGAPRRERAINPPESFRLDGPSIALTSKLERATVLHLRADEPLVGAIVRPSLPGQALLFGADAAADLLLTSGANAVWLRPALGGALRGAVEVLRSEVTAIGEGPGPEALLAPGAARWYSFSVEREGPVGIGVRAVPDTATATLLDASGGRILGSGIVQMPRLAPGTYLLAVRAPADGGPVAVRPALAGLVPPREGPPQEIIRRYLGLSRGEGEAGATPHAPDTVAPEGD